MPIKQKFWKAEEACQGDVDNGFGSGHLATIQDDATFTLVLDCLAFFIILLKIRCRPLQMEMNIHVGPNLVFF